MQPLVILGNGIAGVTLARHLRKRSDVPITIVSDEAPYFFSRTALMYVYMGSSRPQDLRPYPDDFWDKNRLTLRQGRVKSIDFQQKTLIFQEGTPLPYGTLVLAVGSVPRPLSVPGGSLPGVQAFYHWHDLEQMQADTAGIAGAVVIGGGLIGVELAEMLHSRGIAVTMLIREKAFWASVLPPPEAERVTQRLRRHGITLLTDTEVAAFVAGPGGRLAAVQTTAGQTLPCSWAGVGIGVRPNVDFLQKTALQLNTGILTDAYLQTNLPDVYAIGDCAELRQPPPGQRAISPLWYTGRLMGQALAATLAGHPTPYCPGVFFNSAKFFDWEYQTYGHVPTQCPENQDSFCWESPDGEQWLRLCFEREGRAVTGMLALGLRLRQAACEAFIKQRTPVEAVLARFEEARFDPEFTRNYVADLQAAFSRKFDFTFPKKKKNWFF